MAPDHVNGVRDHLVDLVSAEDFAALGRVMNTVSDHLVAAHPEMEIGEDAQRLTMAVERAARLSLRGATACRDPCETADGASSAWVRELGRARVRRRRA